MTEEELTKQQLEAWTAARKMVSAKIDLWNEKDGWTGDITELLIKSLEIASEGERKAFYNLRENR